MLIIIFFYTNQYLIENEEHQVIGIDLCALTYNHHYDELDLEELTPDQYYQVGLYYYDQKKYDQALECFHLGEECEDSDCLCVLGYMYEKGQGVKFMIIFISFHHHLNGIYLLLQFINTCMM